MSDRIYYAIGDVHGEVERLDKLLDAIRAHRAAAGDPPATLVLLGDLIDRGPDSRGVLRRCRALQAEATEAFGFVAVKGNHEDMLLKAWRTRAKRDVSHWLVNGGAEALNSYIDDVDVIPDDFMDYIDVADIAFLESLPTMFRDEARGLVFVHAGVEPAQFPNCPEEARLWTRSERFFDERLWPDRPELKDILIVHGHTPTQDFRPDWWPRRLNIDTGAVFGGPLTCAVLAPDAAPRFLTA